MIRLEIIVMEMHVGFQSLDHAVLHLHCNFIKHFKIEDIASITASGTLANDAELTGT